MVRRFTDRHPILAAYAVFVPSFALLVTVAKLGNWSEGALGTVGLALILGTALLSMHLNPKFRRH